MDTEQAKIRNMLAARKAKASRQLINVLLDCSVTDDAWQAACADATVSDLQQALEQCPNKTGMIAIALGNGIASRKS